MDQQLEAEHRASGAATDADAKVTLVYFASVRETIGASTETVVLAPGVSTVGELMDWLRGRGAGYEAALSDALGVRSAVDHVHATADTSVRGAREIAIFPMMTGG